MQVILPGHLKTAVMQNTQIGQNTSRDRVLDRHDTVLGSAALDLPGHFAERIAGNDFRPLAQKATRDDMMETTFVALNGDARSHAAHSLRLRPFVLACHLHLKKNRTLQGPGSSIFSSFDSFAKGNAIPVRFW